MRHAVNKSEYKIAMPHLYNSRVRGVKVQKYQHQAMLYQKAEDLDSPAFSYESHINPISARHFADEDVVVFDDEDDGFKMPTGMFEFLKDEPLQTEMTANAIGLYWAPHPFDKRSGYTRRAQDIPLVN